VSLIYHLIYQSEPKSEPKRWGIVGWKNIKLVVDREGFNVLEDCGVVGHLQE
jgi:hypothetical protein